MNVKRLTNREITRVASGLASVAMYHEVKGVTRDELMTIANKLEVLGGDNQ